MSEGYEQLTIEEQRDEALQMLERITGDSPPDLSDWRPRDWTNLLWAFCGMRAEIATLETRVRELEARVQGLEARVRGLWRVAGEV